jgi:hypothetical protein
MKNKKDLEQQQSFDNIIYSKEDEAMYNLLFSELDKEDDIVIKPSFAPDIAVKLAKKKKRDQFKENLLFGMAIFTVIAITVGSFQFIKVLLNSEKALIDMRVLTPVIVLVGMISIFQILDKSLIRNKRFNRIKHKTQ